MYRGREAGESQNVMSNRNSERAIVSSVDRVRCRRIRLSYPRPVPFGHWQAVEEPLQLPFHIAHRLNVRPGKTTVPPGDGRAGEKDLRFANSSAAALPDGLFEQTRIMPRMSVSFPRACGIPFENQSGSCGGSPLRVRS